MLFGYNNDKEKQTVINKSESQEQMQLKLEEIEVINGTGKNEKTVDAYKICMTLPNGKTMCTWDLKVTDMIQLVEAGAEIYSTERNEQSDTNMFTSQVIVFSKENGNKIWEEIFVPEIMAALMAGNITIDGEGQ